MPNCEDVSDAITEIERACLDEWTHAGSAAIDPLISSDYVASGAFGERDTILD